MYILTLSHPNRKGERKTFNGEIENILPHFLMTWLLSYIFMHYFIVWVFGSVILLSYREVDN